MARHPFRPRYTVTVHDFSTPVRVQLRAKEVALYLGANAPPTIFDPGPGTWVADVPGMLDKTNPPIFPITLAVLPRKVAKRLGYKAAALGNLAQLTASGELVLVPPTVRA